MRNLYLSVLSALSATAFLMAPVASAQVIVTTPTDDIVAVARSFEGFSNANSDFPAAESPRQAIDQNPATKYLNFQGAGFNNDGVRPGNADGFPTGFIVTLAVPASIDSFQMTAANDAPSRDPSQILIEGSNQFDTASEYLTSPNESPALWNTIYSGPSGLMLDQPRLTPGDLIEFDESAVYSSYRVTIQDLFRVPNNAPTFSQFADIALLGTPVPEPVSLGLAGLGGLALLARRRPH